ASVAAHFGMTPAHVGIGQHDIAFGQAPDRQRLFAYTDSAAVAEHDGTGRPARALGHVTRYQELAGAQARGGFPRDADRAHERVALVASVFADGVAQLAHQRVGEALEALRVAGTDCHMELIGRDQAAHANRSMEVHFAGQPPAQLYWLEA